MKRALLVAVAVASVFVVLAQFADAPRYCEQCGARMEPHERNEGVMECGKCGWLVHVSRSEKARD